VSVAVGPNAQSDSQGGNTSAKSGDAQGGDGGNAKASGGDAKAGNVASVKQSSADGAGKSSEGPANKSKVEQGENEASGGPAQATGGHGGSANSGNVQAFNGNSVSYAAGPKAKAESQGGDTSAKSGDAQGGDGGNAKASGGDAQGGDVAHVTQKSKAHGKKKKHRPCDKVRIVKDEQSGGDANRSKVEQGEYNLAEGGPAQAAGGHGGWADSGNVQEGNGNSFAKAESWQNAIPFNVAEQCGCLPKKEKGPKASSQGGDTSAKSGDAYGGDGGDAKAVGGDAVAGNLAKVAQLAS
jgi:hypothetical protein